MWPCVPHSVVPYFFVLKSGYPRLEPILPAAPDTSKKYKKIPAVCSSSCKTHSKNDHTAFRKCRPLPKSQNCPRTENGRGFTFVLFAFTLLTAFLCLTAQTRKRRRRAQILRDNLYTFNVLRLSTYIV